MERGTELSKPESHLLPGQRLAHPWESCESWSVLCFPLVNRRKQAAAERVVINAHLSALMQWEVLLNITIESTETLNSHPCSPAEGKPMNQGLWRQHRELRPTSYKNTALWFPCSSSSSCVSAKERGTRVVGSCLGDSQQLCSPGLLLSSGEGQHGQHHAPGISRSSGKTSTPQGHEGHLKS